LPGWLHAGSRYIAPASFAALTASALFIDGGEVVLAFAAPKPWAALVAALVAWHTRNVLATIASGMLALSVFKMIF
jgi:branched-subunit amino acid transport protein